MEPHTACETRVLHRLALARAFDTGTDPAERRLGLFVDCETTGADWTRDVVVELALLPFTYTADGRLAEVLADEAQVHLRDPGRALATGADEDDARGRHIDAAAAGALMARANLVVAHNARFDRPFIERVVPAARERPWACSRLEVPWRASGAPSDALHCLLCHYGVFAGRRHRALADCEAGVWLLGQRLPGAGRGVLALLVEAAAAETVRLWALGSPIGAKHVLRARGYRWCPEPRGEIPRAWWTEVAPELVESERAWLAAAVYAGAPAPVAMRRVSARERFRADPADCGPPID